MDFRTRLEQGRSTQTLGEPSPELEEHPISEYFATDRVKAYPACLELRIAPGIRKALPYSYFTEITYNNEIGIEIFTSGKRVRIVGRNLLELFDCLINYRVRYVQASIGNDQNEDGLFVREILIEGSD